MATLKIQRTAPASSVDQSAWDIETAYSGKIVLQDMPSEIPLKPKNIYSHSWFDENGDDEYMPETIFYEPVTIAMKFAAKVDNASGAGTLRSTVRSFLDAITGKTFKFYAPWFGIGRQDCRVESLGEDAAYHNVPIGDGSTYEEQLVFTVNIKINDPATAITL